MRTLFLVLAGGLLALAAAPQNALACHKSTPHGADTSCDGGGGPPPPPPDGVVEPAVVVDSTGAVVGQVNGFAGLEDVEILLRLDDGSLVSGLRVSKRTPNSMPYGEELRSVSPGCAGPFFCVEVGVKPAIFLPLATVGPGDMLYIADDLSDAGFVTTFSNWNSELNECTNVQQNGSACGQVDPVMQLDFVPPFHIE